MKTTIKTYNNTLVLTTELINSEIPVGFINDNAKKLPIEVYCTAAENNEKRTINVTVFLEITEIEDVTLHSVINIMEIFIQTCISFWVDLKKYKSHMDDITGTLKHNLHFEDAKPEDQSTEKNKNIGSRGKRSSEIVDEKK